MLKNRKGISVMIGYVLLVSMAVVMGGVLYAWMSSYIPADSLDCPEGASILLESYECDGISLNLTLLNNGRFDLGGYHLKASTSADQTVATLDLTSYLQTIASAFKYPDHQAVLIGTGSTNSFVPGNSTINSFDISSLGQLHSLEIIPIRWERDEDKKLRFVTCGNSITKQDLVCA